MSDLSLLGSQAPHLFAVVELQDLFVGFLILASTIAYLIWLVKEALNRIPSRTAFAAGLQIWRSEGFGKSVTTERRFDENSALFSSVAYYIFRPPCSRTFATLSRAAFSEKDSRSSGVGRACAKEYA